MATNVSYASGDTNLEALVLHCLPDFGEHGDGIINSNFLTAMLKEKGCYKEVEGGLEFWYGIDYSENSNFKWQGKNDDMTANSQDPSKRLRFEPKIFTGSVVLNDFDKARNKGRAAIKEYLTTLNKQADSTIKNQFNSAFWKASPGTNDVDSIPSIVSATPTTGTVGGLSRASETYLRNGVYSTAIADIGSEAGIGDLARLQFTYAVGQSIADIVIMDQIRFANLVAYLTTLMRWKPSDKMAQLKIPSIEMGGATIGYENRQVTGTNNTITAGYMYGLNSNFLMIKRLIGETQDGWEREFRRVGVSLNKAVFYEWFGNLSTNNPRAHWVATSLT